MVIKTAVRKELETLFEQAGNQLIVLYGRTDSEKELLIKNFVQEKRYFYYRARRVSAAEQVRQMGIEAGKRFDVRFQKQDYEEYFKRVKSGDATKLVLVVDEFQMIAKKDPAFMEAVLKLKAKRLYPGPVMILLCSSSIPWVERDMDGCMGEAAKKIDRRIKIGNLNFLEVVRALPEYPVSECIKAYGIVGGVPGYMNRLNPKADLKTNICRQMLSRNGYFYNAPERLLSEHLRELSVYETILGYIALGCDKLNDLYAATGFSRAKISVYMKNLAASDIVEKVVSFETGGWENTKKGVYRIKDNYCNFWFHFVYPHLSEHYLMGAEEFYDAYIAPGLDAYLNRYFVDVCMEYLALLGMVHKTPLSIARMGTWVGKEGNIDIIAQNEIRQNMVGLCNWSKPELTMEMCENLFVYMKQAKIKAEYYFLFSAKGFSTDVREMAEQNPRFLLVDMNEL